MLLVKWIQFIEGFLSKWAMIVCKSAKGQAKGWTSFHWIHRTGEWFLGGGQHSERAASKKSLDNYLQLWAWYCATLRMILFATANARKNTYLHMNVQFLTRQWFLISKKKGQLWLKCVYVESVVGGRRDTVETWAKANVIGSSVSQSKSCL